MLNAKVSHARGTVVGVGSPQGWASWQGTCQAPGQLEMWDASAPHRNATSSQAAQQTAVAFLYSSSFSPCPSKSQQKAPLVACRASGVFLCGAGQVVPWWREGVGSLRAGIEEHG